MSIPIEIFAASITYVAFSSSKVIATISSFFSSVTFSRDASNKNTSLA
jgi:hypothetical protein